MKKLLYIFCFTLLITQMANGQQTEPTRSKSTQELHNDYIQKYKTNKTVGWVLLGSGVGMIIGGGAVYATYAAQGYNGPAPVTAEFLFLIVGPGFALASIPFFIWGKKNKTKAELVLKGESVTFGNKELYKSNYTALALRIRF